VQFSKKASVFIGRVPPEEGVAVGYAAIISSLDLPVPLPAQISLISTKHKKYQTNGWNIFGPKYQPKETLYKQLVFALKYEGINLLFYKKLFQYLETDDVIDLVQAEPAGQYSRKIWFLYEWLMGKRLPLENADVKIKYVDLLDGKLQYALENGQRSYRHRIVNNLPGTPDFCPLVFKTRKLENYITQNLSEQQDKFLGRIHRDILLRTSSFLLLEDSKASFTIEGESPQNKRVARWGKAIGEAGKNSLSEQELLRLQRLVIGDTRFVEPGYRREGGFVGDHDRITGEPLPEHISARWQDLDQLMGGLITAHKQLETSLVDPVIAAAMVAFGFVFIHPFQDGNGRIHRYLVHHMLARKSFTRQGVIFPVSASILEHITDYRRVLQTYSQSLLDFIEWQRTSDNNVEVLNETIDYYRYFDATPQAEFLYDCVYDTIHNIIPREAKYLENYDSFKHFLDSKVEMPNKTVALLVRFLEQNDGKLSKRARENEFAALNDKEIAEIEYQYRSIFLE